MNMILLVTYRPDEFIDCEDPVDHVGNATASQELGYGCLKVSFCFIHELLHREIVYWLNAV